MQNKIDFLLKPAIQIPQIGPKNSLFLAKLGIKKVIDLIFHKPSNLINIKQFPKIASVNDGEFVTLKVKIERWDEKSYSSKSSRKRPFKIYCSNETGHLSLVYFNFYPNFIVNKLKIGEEKYVSGKLEKFQGESQICYPDYIIPSSSELPSQIEVIYPVTLGLTSKQIRKYINTALGLIPELEEWVDHSLIISRGWMNFKEAILSLHNPLKFDDILPISSSHTRLAYDELLANQLAIHLMRFYKTKSKGRSFSFTGKLSKQVLENLEFELTEGQRTVLSEIEADQKLDNRMIRLIQGDVGSGKTLVALCAMLNIVESGNFQACLMVPLDILANQHYQFISNALAKTTIKVGLLTGKVSGKVRTKLFSQLKNSEIQILIGTHAVFQEEVEFADLALIIIDEQHRFGVEQRASLYAKGNIPDLLAMTATPIPRTLALALYGDMDLSMIKDKPKGRIPIKTSLMHISKSSELMNSLAKMNDSEDLIYWICPLIEENPDDNNNNINAAAISRYNQLIKIFGNKIGLVHGKLKTKEKEAAIEEFSQGKYKILVATTVIEVGIDIKKANIIIIEQAEKFGLAQLHQLRGRVGRGNTQSYCILLYSDQASKLAKQKLTILKNTNDGFILAEEDLKIRGSGDIVGLKQSGLPDFKFALMTHHQELLFIANNDAKEIVKSDPKLSSESGKNLKNLLRLFGYESANLKQ